MLIKHRHQLLLLLLEMIAIPSFHRHCSKLFLFLLLSSSSSSSNNSTIIKKFLMTTIINMDRRQNREGEEREKERGQQQNDQTSSGSIKQRKIMLRKMMSTRINQLTLDDIAHQSKLIQEKLFKLNEFQISKRIGLYLSMPKEVDTLNIMRKCFEDGKQCFVPRYHPSNPLMEMVEIYSYDDYESLPIEPKYRIKQPPMDDDSRPEAISTGGLDLILVPGVAFTKNGLRLGHGKGYYDRWLANCFSQDKILKPITIGLALRQQIVDKLPISEFDVPIQHVIDPS